MHQNFSRNNLAQSSSPYLRQHAGNPIWWQEWNSETLAYAEAEKKPLLVSVGYATCHWCHVMAAEAFSDQETADFINNTYVSIKVDREQRPDIDHYMMSFIQAQTGAGGWPLNVFLTHDLKPVHALTYAPVKTSGGRYSFLRIATDVTDHMHSRGENLLSFRMPEQEAPPADSLRLTERLVEYYDNEHGGFGMQQKFPPHSTLLFMLYRLATASGDGSPDGHARRRGELADLAEDISIMREVVISTLDAMMTRGLNDHLQGGIYRYCVDRSWTIPHFEKMLYDQALALWTYSLAWRETGRDGYKRMAEMIIRSLEETFTLDGMYATAFNADTSHREGATYLWSLDELTSLLTPADLKRLKQAYEITAAGNFEGMNHLIRKEGYKSINSAAIRKIEEKLLAARRERPQPSRDDKILSGLNALTAAALIQAGRMLNKPALEKRAAEVVTKVLETFWDGEQLAHSYYDGVLQRQTFLSDAAPLLLTITMLYESDPSWGEMMESMASYVRSFRDGDRWVESDATDFRKIYASWFDHPVPSAVSLAATALTRHALLTDSEVRPAVYRRPYQSDFYNINVLLTEDLFHLFTTAKPLSWRSIPVSSLQRRGEPESVCHKKSCRPLPEGWDIHSGPEQAGGR